MTKSTCKKIEKIPQNFRLAYKDYPVNTIPSGFIKMLQNLKNDPANDELWKEINEFMERELDAEDQPHTLQ